MNTDKIFAKQILNEYSKKNDSKIAELRRLDRRVRLPAEIFAYSFGIVAALVFGTGMCFAMQIIGHSMLLGIVLGIVGIFCVCINYPIYKRILETNKAKYSSEIITLAKEIAEEK